MRLTMVRGEALGALTVSTGETVRAAMQTMNATGRTLIMVVADGRLEGVVSDGDIRRYLADGGSVGDVVAGVVNRSPTTMPAATPAGEVRAYMLRRGFDEVPIVDGESLVALALLEHAPRATDLSAVVLAGGVGSRLAPLTDDCPKPLLPLGAKPILGHILDHLRQQGVSRFVLAVNYLAEMIVDHFEDGRASDVFIEYIRETKALGTGGPLGLVDPDALSDPFLCLNGDIVNDIDVHDLMAAHAAGGWDATMVVHSHNLTVPYGVVDADDDGRFVRIVEKPVLPFRVNAGIYLFSKSVLPIVPTNQFYDMPTLFEDLSRHGLRSGVHVHEGRWIDIGTMSEYRRAQVVLGGEEPSW